LYLVCHNNDICIHIEAINNKKRRTAALLQKKANEKSDKKEDYDALIDMVGIIRKLDQKDYDALVSMIMTLKADKERSSVEEKRIG
jgi:transcription elongation factor GreA-like protein